MLKWETNPYIEGPEGGDTQYQIARTPRFTVFRFYEVGPGQTHWFARSREPEFSDKPGYCPHPEIVLVTKGLWRFEAPGLPDGDHGMAVNDGGFTVRAKDAYRVTSEAPNGNGYVCIRPNRRDWYAREVVQIPAGDTVILPARSAETFLYVGKGLATVGGADADPNEIIELPAGQETEVTAVSKVTAITFWQSSWPSTLAELG